MYNIREVNPVGAHPNRSERDEDCKTSY